MIKLRWLDGEESVKRINPLLQERGWTLLNANMCRVLTAFDGDEIVGFYCFQMFPHAEPLWTKPELRGDSHRLTKDLVDGMESFLNEVNARGVMVIADSPFAEKMCQERGMRRVESPVYIGGEYTGTVQ